MRTHLAILALVTTLSLVGCGDLTRDVAKAGADPKMLMAAYVSVATSVFLVLAIFRDKTTVWRDLLDTMSYVGLAALVTSPLYYTASGNFDASLALAISGLLGVAAVRIAFKDQK